MKKLVLVVIGIIMFQGGSPEPVYRLHTTSDAEETSYYQGSEFIHLEKDSIELAVSYYEHTANLFALDVEVVNKSNSIVRVAPDSFAYKSYDHFSPENPGNFLSFKKAEDPERKLLNLDMALSRQRANQKTDEFLFTTVQGLTLVNAATSETKKEREKAGERLTKNRIEQE